MSYLPAAVVLWGIAWAARSAIGLADPNYYDPVNAIDHAAVWTYSAALLLSAVVAWMAAARVGADRGTATLGTIAGVGFAAAALANWLEDGFDIPALATPYVVGVLVGFGGSLLFAAALLRVRARLLSAVALALAAAFLSLSSWLGIVVVVAGAWFGWRLARAPLPR